MAEEFVSAFHDMQRDATNNERLVEFVRSYYANTLDAPEFYSALQLRLEQPLNEPPSIVQNFFHDISLLCTKHRMMAETLKSMNTNLTKQLRSVAVSKKLCSVSFNAAAMACAAAAAIAAANVFPVGGWARAGVGAAAAAGAVLFTAVGKWRRSVLAKREAAVKKLKEITDHMIMVARPIMTDLSSVYCAARSLEFEIESLSEAVDDDGEKVAAVGKSFEELLRSDEKYNSVMNWAKELVLHSIVNQLG